MIAYNYYGYQFSSITIPKKKTELIQYMEKLVKWRQRQIPQAAASRERERET